MMPDVLVDTLAALISALAVLAAAFTWHFINQAGLLDAAHGDEHLSELIDAKNKELKLYVYGLVNSISKGNKLPPPPDGSPQN